jgi:hypothetical protein
MRRESSPGALAFVDLLSDADIAAALDVRQNFTLRYQRYRRLDHFRESLTTLCSYVEQQRDDDWKRALVTGICPCGSVLAINNARFQAFTRRSKSSVNELFSKLRYRTIPINQRNQRLILRKIPFLEAHAEELRQWTFRALAHCPAPGEPAPGAPPGTAGAPGEEALGGGEWETFGDGFWMDPLGL